MPAYDYKCTNCNNVFEVRKGMNEEIKDLTCPKCKSSAVKRVFGKFAIGSKSQFSGSEFGGSGKSCGSCSSGVCNTCNH